MSNHDPQLLTINPGAMTADGDLFMALQVPTGWGGITVLGAVVNWDATGTANVQLLNYGTGGTSLAASGTIAQHASGTANVWAAATPEALTVTAAQAFVDEGEYVYLKKVESAGDNDPGVNWSCCIQYVHGIVSQG